MTNKQRERVARLIEEANSFATNSVTISLKNDLLYLTYKINGKTIEYTRARRLHEKIRFLEDVIDRGLREVV